MAAGNNEIEVVEQSSFWRVTLNRPPQHLLDPPLMAALRETILELDALDEVKATVITGARDVFCGGLDLAQIRAGASALDFATALTELLRIFPTCAKPIIAAVNGDALASGYSIACAADIAIAVPDARLGTLETSAGIWPMVAQVPPLKRLATRHALENILTGTPFSAERAREVGVVNDVVDPSQLWDEIERWATLSIRAGSAMAAGRQAFYRFVELPYDDALTASLDEFRRMFES
jgi:enoyl-CoA hydratase/carnithine racemase